MKRRDLLALAAAGLTGMEQHAFAKQLSSSELELTELSLAGDSAFGRVLLAVPRKLDERPELAILLHGLGETYDQTVGARAFAERYGLLSAVARLAHPPVVLSDPDHDYFGAGRLEELNRELGARPFRCPVLVCPFTPNPYKPHGEEVAARFAGFVTGRLKETLEQRLGVAFPASRCMISGVSLGGYLAIEIFLKSPRTFAGLVTAQGAFGPNQAARYAAAPSIAAQRIEILTSSFDPYRRPNELFYKHLQGRGVTSRLRVSPGPHDQRWLNESGVIEMLLAAQAVLQSPPEAAP